MTEDSRAHTFAAALRELEKTADPTNLVACFAADAELRRPELDGASGGGADDAHAFWQSYLSPFQDIRTEFVRIVEAEDLAVLEWESQGTLSAGSPIGYRGVSLLTFDDDGLVTRFATYFDTAAFTAGKELA